MTHEEIQDLIPAYALGALDVQEAAVLLQHLQTCDSCPRLLAEYREALGALPGLVPEAAPPESLKGRTMARLEPAQRGTGLASRLRGLNWSRLALAWAPLSLLLLIGLLWANISLNNALRERTEAVIPQVVVVALQGTEFAPQAKGMIVAFPQNGMAMLAVKDLPPPPPGQEYQLWLIRNDERDNGGTFTLDSQGRGYLVVEIQDFALYRNFGITMEPAGGSPAPTGDRYMFGNI